MLKLLERKTTILFALLSLNFIIQTPQWAHSAGQLGSSAESSPVAAEPPYCNPKTFFLFQTPEKESALLYHQFRIKIGQVSIHGLGVGMSSASQLKSQAEEFQIPASKKSCTWYFNNFHSFWDERARTEFNWHYVDRNAKVAPANKTIAEATGDLYLEKIGPSFSSLPNNFLDCMNEERYLALGCAGMNHRGPGVFAMLLSYLGCSPKNAVEIVNQVWGANEIPFENRLEIAKRGATLGQADEAKLKGLKALLDLNSTENRRSACDHLEKVQHVSAYHYGSCHQARIPADVILACGKISLSSLVFARCLDFAEKKSLNAEKVLSCQEKPILGSFQRQMDCLSNPSIK